jgi:hypothetical protein
VNINISQKNQRKRIIVISSISLLFSTLTLTFILLLIPFGSSIGKMTFWKEKCLEIIVFAFPIASLLTAVAANVILEKSKIKTKIKWLVLFALCMAGGSLVPAILQVMAIYAHRSGAV